MTTMIFGYAGPISGLQKALDEYIEQQLYEYDTQDMGDSYFSGYCSSQCRHFGSGCETI